MPATPALDLRQAFVQAFNLDELALLCMDLGVNADSIPYRERGLETWAQEIIAFFQRRGELPRLTAQCQLLRPQIDWASLPVPEPEIVAVPTQAAPTTVIYNIDTGGGAYVGGDVSAGVFAGRDQTNNAIASAGAGLRALNLLKAQPDVARLLGGAQADLQNTLDQIVYLGDYKEMHDQLHQLQFDCLAFLVRGADKFPDDAEFCVTLGSYTDKFGEVAGRLREIGGRPALRRANEEAWIGQLAQVLQLLREAIDAADKPRYTRGVGSTRSLLDKHLARINIVLVTAARNLQFDRLLTALDDVSGRVRGLALPPEDRTRADDFSAGAAALRSLSEQLNLQVNAHDRWQEVETNLREIERDPVPKLVDELRWEDLKQIAQPLYAGGDQDGLAEMREMHQKLQAAIDAADGKQITRQFNAYRRKAGTCFYQVDSRLRSLCASLAREVRPQLSGLLDETR